MLPQIYSSQARDLSLIVENQGIQVIPVLANSISKFIIEYPDISGYERDFYRTVISNITDISVDRAFPRNSLGRVISFEVLPSGNPDPTIVLTQGVDLTEYIWFWGKAVKNDFTLYERLNKKRMIFQRYEAIVLDSIRRAKEILNFNETLFMAVEMLKLKNEVLLRNYL